MIKTLALIFIALLASQAQAIEIDLGIGYTWAEKPQPGLWQQQEFDNTIDNESVNYQIKLLFEENKECRRLYHQVDKLTYGIAIAIKLKKKVSTIKQSANASGDHALDRDITP